MHPNEDLIRRTYAAVAAGDLEAVRMSLADDIAKAWLSDGFASLRLRRLRPLRIALELHNSGLDMRW